MGQVVLMRAIPGSGKSTLAKQLASKAQAEGKKSVICSADDFFYELGQGAYAFDRTKIAEAHKYCFKKFMKAINDKVDLIIVDNTNLTAWEISPYKTFAEVHDYDFSINEVKAKPEDAFKRQEHGVPDFAHQRMAEGFEKESIPPWWKKETFVSKTSPTGEAMFEQELPPEEPVLPKKAARIGRILKQADLFYALAHKYS